VASSALVMVHALPWLPMHCPFCGVGDTKVIDSRLADEGAAIRRRRRCDSCTHRFTTYERLEEVPMTVIKRDGSKAPFDRAKIVTGLSIATKQRPVTTEQLEAIAVEVEDMLRLDASEVTSTRVGEIVLLHLRELDEVAYVRFASVLNRFDGADDFERQLQMLGRQSP
jgi:transcriptional repressor NrdR